VEQRSSVRGRLSSEAQFGYYSVNRLIDIRLTSLCTTFATATDIAVVYQTKHRHRPSYVTDVNRTLYGVDICKFRVKF